MNASWIGSVGSDSGTNSANLGGVLPFSDSCFFLRFNISLSQCLVDHDRDSSRFDILGF
ncbi:hypothetical protein RBSH_03369 [Rhodopirellula baltica SH28]|uniref:Uncharacterized protein n=1 Tax=Rhodopirellula baltica SH28 TaxID=993517 RepID=K5DFU9_RHOBT|nr:hypothetical protein RBSH_03369 [Rhodopirellula baltica SH28]